MDNTIRCWDVKPYASGDRCTKYFLGAQHSYEKGLLRCSWSPTGTQVAAGSADNFVYVWDASTRRIAYKLPGHQGSVNEVDFHPTQPIICSCGNDRQIFVRTRCHEPHRAHHTAPTSPAPAERRGSVVRSSARFALHRARRGDELRYQSNAQPTSQTSTDCPKRFMCSIRFGAVLLTRRAQP